VNGKINSPDNFSFFQRSIPLALQSDGKILTIAATGFGHFSVARFLSNGMPDVSFGTNGIFTISFHDYDAANPGNYVDEVPQNILVQPDGKVIVIGSVYNINAERNQLALARFSNNTNPFIALHHDTMQAGSNLSRTVPITIAPNPVRDVLHIKELSATATNRLYIIGVAGSIVKAVTVVNKQSYDWYLKGLSKGIYTLLVESNGNRRSLKFIKE
jgi:hypothetical protein